MIEPLSDADLNAIEAGHPDEHGRCPRCHSTRHPCEARVLVAEVRRLKRALQAATPREEAGWPSTTP